MGYKILYADSGLVMQQKRSRILTVKWICGVAAILLAGGLVRLKPVRDFLIPGDPEVTKAAVVAFAQDLRSGERFQDAAVTFCRQIIDADSEHTY